jgi:hypothetical protein
MNWTPLPTGSFTGIDWSKPAATAGADPYLIWAEADQFSGYGDKEPRWMPVAIEIQTGTSIEQLVAAASPRWLRIPAVYTSDIAPAKLRFCTARVRPEFFKAISVGGGLHHMVKRLELGLPAGPHARAPVEGRENPAKEILRHDASAQLKNDVKLLSGKVLGLIDDSLALAHANFLTRSDARTAFFWRQDNKGKGRAPAGFGYGHELTAADIDAAMKRRTFDGLVDEAAVYVDLGLSVLGQKWPKGHIPFHALDTALSHGTHVMDIAGGPRSLLAQISNLPPDFDAPPNWEMADDDASASPIVAVQLDYATVEDTSGGSMNVHVLDGLMYILSRCASDAQVVVNISFGTLAGPHDGTSVLEAAMDQLLDLYRERLQIVIAAGNSYQLRTHANLTLTPNTNAALHWRVAPDDSSQSFLELWFPQGANAVEIEITPPGQMPLPALGLGHSGMWLGGGKAPLCALIYPRHVATGERGTCALLAVAPTFSFSQEAATAPSGAWRIRLSNATGRPVTVDAYIERDDVVIGTRSGAKQSYFEDDPALPRDDQYDMQAFTDDPARKTPIRRSGNFNSIATGSRTTSVGGVRVADENAWAHYSPRRPDPDHARPKRADVVKMPTTKGYSDENAALAGISAAGTRSTAAARLKGTSDAAPQIARKLLNDM